MNKLEPEDIIEFIRDAGRPCSMRDVSDALGANHETVTWRMRRMVSEGRLVVAGQRKMLRGDANLFAVVEGEATPSRAWVAARQLEGEVFAEIREFCRTEIEAALRTWSEWVKSGRPRLDWRRDAHMAMSMGMDRVIEAMEPHERSAIHSIWCGQPWGWRRYDRCEAYEDAQAKIRLVFDVS